jgi:hypothetical protein
MTTNYNWTIRFTILTPILIIICVLLMGGGHGWYTPTMVVFPWATINTIWEDQLSKPLLIAGIFQFTVYGFLIDKTKRTKSRNWVITGILLSHILLATVILSFINPKWT